MSDEKLKPCPIPGCGGKADDGWFDKNRDDAAACGKEGCALHGNPMKPAAWQALPRPSPAVQEVAREMRDGLALAAKKYPPGFEWWVTEVRDWASRLDQSAPGVGTPGEVWVVTDRPSHVMGVYATNKDAEDRIAEIGDIGLIPVKREVHGSPPKVLVETDADGYEEVVGFAPEQPKAEYRDYVRLKVPVIGAPEAGEYNPFRITRPMYEKALADAETARGILQECRKAFGGTHTGDDKYTPKRISTLREQLGEAETNSSGGDTTHQPPGSATPDNNRKDETDELVPDGSLHVDSGDALDNEKGKAPSPRHEALRILQDLIKGRRKGRWVQDQEMSLVCDALEAIEGKIEALERHNAADNKRRLEVSQ